MNAVTLEVRTARGVGVTSIGGRLHKPCSNPRVAEELDWVELAEKSAVRGSVIGPSGIPRLPAAEYYKIGYSSRSRGKSSGH